MEKEKVEISDLDRVEIARLIAEGNVSGRLDCDNGKHISWKIDMDVWVEGVEKCDYHGVIKCSRCN